MLLGLGSVQIKASLLRRSGGLHLGYVIIFIFMIEVTQWRDGMVKFYCDERFGGLGGLCSTGGSRCMCRGES